MNGVKVLVEGYAKVNSDGTWDATCIKTLEIADYIIPGHGKMFKVQNENR